MEKEIKIKIKLDDNKISKVPKIDDDGNIIDNEFEDKEVIEELIFGSIKEKIESYVDSEDFEVDLAYDLSFENVEDLDDMEKTFGLEIEVEGE